MLKLFSKKKREKRRQELRKRYEKEYKETTVIIGKLKKCADLSIVEEQPNRIYLFNIQAIQTSHFAYQHLLMQKLSSLKEHTKVSYRIIQEYLIIAPEEKVILQFPLVVKETW